MLNLDAIEVHGEATDDAVADFVSGGVVGAVGVYSADGEVGSGVEFVAPEACGGKWLLAEVIAEGIEEAGIKDEDPGATPAKSGDGGALIFNGVVSGDQGSGSEDVVFSGFLDFDESAFGGVP